MAYHELLNPETFRYCCEQIRAVVNVQDVEDMEDVVVGVLAHILHNLATRPERYVFEDREAVRRYLRGAIRNVCRKLMSASSPASMDSTLLARMSAGEMTQQQEYLKIELQQLLACLPRAYAAVLELYIRGYRIAEISALLQIKEGTVKSRLYRARQALAESCQLGW